MTTYLTKAPFFLFTWILSGSSFYHAATWIPKITVNVKASPIKALPLQHE